MNDKSSENRASWPLYSQSFYYSFDLDNDIFTTYNILFKTLTNILKKGYAGKSSLSRENE